MPAPAPFPSPNGANNALFPALYLYPLNDSWAPKHIALTNQHTKIGRQTSSKTAPGERNGFFDSKVLSRQHAEVWEEGGKIFIKDVKSSNGTFINGERLSSEGHESEPFELKSDDIVEFGIDIVGEDNKTIIHHKVAARVVCVFSEQDAQVAARAEQHQQQQQLHQQQYLQQQQQASGGGSAGLGPGGPSGVNGVVGGVGGVGGGAMGGVAGNPQSFPFAAQRRAQLAQQGLGGMGGMRPPGKTGLSFDVILSRLQGELQKSRETGAELNSLTGAMSEIHDTLGGALPATLPPFPANLPPVRPPQEAQHQTTSTSPSPEQPSLNPSAAVSAAAVVDLQSQLRDTQSSLASHLDKVRALEGVLAEQEVMKQEVKSLREMMEERRRDMEQERVRKELGSGQRHRRVEEQEPRGGFDMEEEDDDSDREVSDDDDDDDARSISTVMPHELERVEEEDEEQLAEEEREHDEPPVDEHGHGHEPDEDHAEDDTQHSEADPNQTQSQAEADAEAEEQERRREDLGVGRPRTPEPTRLGLRGDSDTYPTRTSSLLGAPRRSLSSPLSQVSSSELRTSNAIGTNGTIAASTDDVYEQVVKLSKQVGAVMALTTSLEAQHTAAQSTIRGLESKVDALEEMLKSAEEELRRKAQGVTKPEEEESKVDEVMPEKEETLKEVEENEKASLVDMMAEWKKSVEGQWGTVQEEWTQERERLSKARQEWEAKVRQVDSGLEKMLSMQSTLAIQQQQIQVELQHSHTLHQHHPLQHHLGMANGDALKHNGGLVTPPSPRSQSSDSAGRYRRRRRRSSGSRGRSSSRGRGSSGSRGGGEDGAEEVDMHVPIASSTEDEVFLNSSLSRKAAARALGTSATGQQAHAAARSLATPEPSVYKLSSSIGSLDTDSSSSPSKDKERKGILTTTRSNSEDTASLSKVFDLVRSVVLILLTWLGLGMQHLSSLLSGDGASPTTTAGTTVPTISVQTAIGVVLLSVAAAAVFWKVKPE